MKVLFLNAYFAPEVISFTHLEKDIVEALLADGHEIEVLCPTPTRGIDTDTAKKYKKIKSEDMYGGKVRVKRFSAPREGRNPIVRAFRYFWCNFREWQLGRKYKDIDAVFCVSTPPTQGMLAAKVAKKLSKKAKRKVPFIYSLQDVFPDSLVTTGLAKEGSLIWKIGRKIENYTYSHADKIVVISESIRRNLLNKGVSEEKLEVVSNWIDVNAVKPVAREDNTVVGEFGIDPRKFLVVYAGNFGAAQGADVVIKAAELLKDNEKIHFVIFGGGAEFEAAKKSVADLALSNVTINSLLPQSRVPEVYSLGDVALITCKKGVGNSGMPSKTWSIMACNTPIIAAFDADSELAQIIERAGAGCAVEPENADALAAAILERFNGQGSGTDSRAFVTENASREICSAKYVEILKNQTATAEVCEIK